MQKLYWMLARKLVWKIEYMFMSRHQTAGLRNYIRVDKSFEKVAKFKYLG
jgi:hypothetical protein